MEVQEASHCLVWASRYLGVYVSRRLGVQLNAQTSRPRRIGSDTPTQTRHSHIAC